MDSINKQKSFTIISIEGNIGSGKSTLLKHLKEYIETQDDKINIDLNSKIIFLKEPVDEWNDIKDSNNKTMLEKFYANQNKYSFAFQMMAYISRLVNLKNIIDTNNNVIIITERSLYTDKDVFAKMLFDNNKIEDVEYQIYLKWFDAFADDYPINKIIYINAEPKICYDRIAIRHRQGEDKIPIEYLIKCHNYHNDMIEKYKQCNQLILDGNIDIKHNTEQLNIWICKILSFISN